MTNTARKEMIRRTLSLLEDAETSQDAFDNAREVLSQDVGAGVYDGCHDIYDRAMVALDRIKAGGNARR